MYKKYKIKYNIRENSAEAMNDALKDYLGDDDIKEKVFEDFLDDGSKISVKIKIVKKEGSILPFHAIVDFSGTDSQMDNNLNAPIAVL